MAAIGISAILIGRIPSGQGHITYFRRLQESSMNSPARVISFVNAAHFIDHYSMLIFAAAVIVMGPALGMAYSELLPYATPGFVAFGAGPLLTGWLGARWSRRHMMVIFFAGIGASMIAVGFAESPLQLGAALLSIGLFASIYHPVGTAMIVSYADRLGREMGLNGVWGNLVCRLLLEKKKKERKPRHGNHQHKRDWQRPEAGTGVVRKRNGAQQGTSESQCT